MLTQSLEHLAKAKVAVKEQIETRAHVKGEVILLIHFRPKQTVFVTCVSGMEKKCSN